jgi:hypothetical protein
MLKKHYYWWLLVSGLVGFSLGMFLKITWEESKFIIAEWDEDPILIICPDSDLSRYRANLAVEWWGIRGYEIAYIHRDKDNTICNNTWREGMIMIRGEGELLPDTLAITSRLAVVNKMIAAQIILPNESRNTPRLLEHELGHAFGMRHAEITGHIMHPIHNLSGENFWIPN